MTSSRHESDAKTSRYVITVAQAAENHGVSRRTIAYAITAGKLSARKLPGRTGTKLLDPDEVEQFCRLRRAEAAGA